MGQPTVGSNPTLSARKTDLFRQVGFLTKSTLGVGEIICDDEIPCGDEIRLDAGWVDLISSEAQLKISSA